MLAPALPAEVPVPVALGRPADGYPFGWYVSPWIDGREPHTRRPIDLCRLAVDLAAVVQALHRIDTADGPAPRRRPTRRTAGRRGRSTRQRAEQLRGETDVDGLFAVWDAGVHAPPGTRPPVWVHGDLSDGNLLTRDGRLAGIIDWGGLLVGDPAVELMVRVEPVRRREPRRLPRRARLRRPRHVAAGPRLGRVGRAPGAALLPGHEPRHLHEVLASRARGPRRPRFRGEPTSAQHVARRTAAEPATGGAHPASEHTVAPRASSDGVGRDEAAGLAPAVQPGADVRAHRRGRHRLRALPGRCVGTDLGQSHDRGCAHVAVGRNRSSPGGHSLWPAASSVKTSSNSSSIARQARREDGSW